MRILIADDHRLVRDAIGAVLASSGDIEVETAADMAEANACLDRNGPFDLVLLDYGMPGVGDLAGLRGILDRHGDKRIALFSGTASNFVVAEAFRLGAAGFVPKTLSPDAMVHAVRLMAGGERYLPVEMMTQPALEGLSGRTIAEILTERETQTLQGLCEGLSNKEIASRHDVQEVTVKLHVKTLCKKLHARNRTHAALIGKELGIC